MAEYQLIAQVTEATFIPSDRGGYAAFKLITVTGQTLDPKSFDGPVRAMVSGGKVQAGQWRRFRLSEKPNATGTVYRNVITLGDIVTQPAPGDPDTLLPEPVPGAAPAAGGGGGATRGAGRAPFTRTPEERMSIEMQSARRDAVEIAGHFIGSEALATPDDVVAWVIEAAFKLQSFESVPEPTSEDSEAEPETPAEPGVKAEPAPEVEPEAVGGLDAAMEAIKSQIVAEASLGGVNVTQRLAALFPGRAYDSLDVSEAAALLADIRATGAA